MTTTVSVAVALLALPASGIAGNGHGNGDGNGSASSCAKTKKVGYSVRGTLVSYTADDPATAGVNEAVVTMTVTGANSHARKSGELADADMAKPGVQVKGGTYVATAAEDSFTVKLTGYEGTDTVSPGDKVKVTGRIPLTRKSCAPDATSVADRYGAPNIRKLKIADRDPDTP